jgi:hypothetical protein
MQKSRRFLWLGLFLIASIPQTLPGQSTKLEFPTLSSAVGNMTSSQYHLRFIAGQNTPVMQGESENFRLSAGFMALSGDLGPAQSVVARVNCPSSMPAACPVTISLSAFVDPGLGEKLGSFTARLQWDAPTLDYTGNSGLMSGYTGLVNTDSVSAGVLLFNGANSTGRDSLISLLQIDFNTAGAAGDSGSINLSFSAMAAAGTFRDLLPDLTVQGCDFTITEAGLLGDVNGDGLVNSTDALIVLSHDVGFEVPDDIRARIDSGIGDTNADGLTNSTDALIILSFDVGFEVPFPLGTKFCPGGA